MLSVEFLVKVDKRMKESIVKQKAFDFSIEAIDVYKLLLAQNEYVLSKQFLRAATSIGANVNEALAGFSKKDFAAKMSISSKEARETLYWVELLEYAQFVEYDFQSLKNKTEELIKMLTSIVKTTQQNIKGN